jgi:hypothetical protein
VEAWLLIISTLEQQTVEKSTGLAAGMSKLNANFRPLRVSKVDDALQGRDLTVLPNTL